MVGQDVVEVRIVDLDPQPPGRVSLGITVDDQYPALHCRHGGPQVDCGRGFPHAALLIGNGQDSSHARSWPPVSLMISSWALGDERRDGTLSFLVLRPISRYTIAASKLAAAAAAAVLINSIGAVAMAGGYAIITGSWELLAPLLVGAFITSIAYVAIFLPVGYLTQWSVFIGLGFVLIFENGIASALGGLATLSPWRIGYSALAALLPPEAPIEDLGNVVPGVGGALAKTVVLVILSIAVLGTLFRTRDIT